MSFSPLQIQPLAEIPPIASLPTEDRGNWFAVYTAPQHEKSVSRHFCQREISHFLPTLERETVWKNRQRVKVLFPLFPGYLFVCMQGRERGRVLSTPGVLRVLGGPDLQNAIPDSTIGFLRSAARFGKLEPYSDVVVGQRVRIKSGALRNVEGVLIRKKGDLRFVISIELINRCAALEVSAEDVEPAIQ